MQNFARNLVVQLKFKHSRERVIVIIRRSIVDVRLGCGVAKLFATRRRRFDALAGTTAALGFTATFCDLVTSLLPSIHISNRQSSGLLLCLWAMSADTLYLAEPANSSRYIFVSALGIWR
jgi:hypothetical protein